MFKKLTITVIYIFLFILKLNMRTILNYSPNFKTIKRKPNQIKFIIFHYTGMKKESEAIERLTSIKSKVSCHYLIKNLLSFFIDSICFLENFL